MFEKLEIFRMAQGLAENAGMRQSVIARNVANADTPGYRAQDVASFADSYQRSAQGLSLRATRRGHLSASDGAARSAELLTPEGMTAINGNSVSLETEMVKAVETKRQHDLALAVYRSSLGIIRTSLGRGR